MAHAISIKDFRSQVRAGKTPNAALRLAQPGAPIATTEERTVSFVFSDGSVDRYGDTIDAKGWVLDAFNANPVALFGHDAGTVENVIGRAKNVRVQGDKLVGDIEFAEASVNPNAETVYQMVKGGYLNTVSVGFQPLEWTQTKDKSRPGGIDFKKQELMEISIVPVPANPNAVTLAKAAGIAVDRLTLVERADDLNWTRDAGAIVNKRGLYSVSDLASVLSQLGWITDSAKWEAECEGDGSQVPTMLLEALKALGAALIAMTTEEVNELIDRLGGETMEKAASPAQDFVIKTAGAFHRGTVGKDQTAVFTQAILKLATSGDITLKAGKKLSSASHSTISDACDKIKGAYDSLAAMIAEPDEDDDGAEEKNAAAIRARKAKALKLKLSGA